MHSKYYGFPAIFLRLLIVTILFGLTISGPGSAFADPSPGPGTDISGVVSAISTVTASKTSTRVSRMPVSAIIKMQVSHP